MIRTGTCTPLLTVPLRLFRWGWVYLLLILSSSGYAQSVTAFPPLQSTGKIPEAFLLSVEELYTRSLARHSNLQGTEASFFLRSAYQQHQLLYSGMVLFGDPASEYLSRVADQILRHRPELRNQLRFHAVRAPEANAFATNDGLILVNIGLLASLQNEAQLAFVLCHEISHYLRQHSLDIFLRNTEHPDQLGNNNDPMPVVSYTQEKELEADRLGWELFLESGYDPGAALNAIGLLMNSAPAGPEIDLRWLEIGNLPFPDSVYKAPLLPVEEQLKESGSYTTTHPRPEDRKSLLAELIRIQQPPAGATSQLPEQDFRTIRDHCRFERCRLLVLNREYEQALYEAWRLGRSYPDQVVLHHTMSNALYGLAKYALAGQLYDVHQPPGLVPMHRQRLHRLIELLSAKDLCALALHHSWQLSRQHPEDEGLRLICRDLMAELTGQFLDSLELLRQNPPARDEADYFFPAMAQLLKDSSFSNALTRLMSRTRQIQEFAETPLLLTLATETPNEQETDLQATGLQLGLDRVVWVDPFYQRMRPEAEANLLLASEQQEALLAQYLRDYAQAIGLDSHLLSSQSMNADSVAAFRHLALLQTWLRERNAHGELELISPLHNEIAALAQAYRTPYFVWVGCLSKQEPRKGKGIVAASGIIFPPILPYAVWFLATPRSETLVYTVIYNVQDGQYLLMYPQRLGFQDRPDFLKSTLYDLVLQLGG